MRKRAEIYIQIRVRSDPDRVVIYLMSESFIIAAVPDEDLLFQKFLLQIRERVFLLHCDTYCVLGILCSGGDQETRWNKDVFP